MLILFDYAISFNIFMKYNISKFTYLPLLNLLLCNLSEKPNQLNENEASFTRSAYALNYKHLKS